MRRNKDFRPIQSATATRKCVTKRRRLSMVFFSCQLTKYVRQRHFGRWP